MTLASVGENWGARVPWSWLGVPQEAAAKQLRTPSQVVPSPGRSRSLRVSLASSPGDPGHPGSAPGQKPPCPPLPWVQPGRKRGGAAGPGAGPCPACVRVGEEAGGRAVRGVCPERGPRGHAEVGVA